MHAVSQSGRRGSYFALIPATARASQNNEVLGASYLHVAL